VIEKLKLLFYQRAEKQEAGKQLPVDKKQYLVTQDLSKTYDGKTQAVKSISLSLSKNQEILGLLGANGAGKSSTFNMVTMQI